MKSQPHLALRLGILALLIIVPFLLKMQNDGSEALSPQDRVPTAKPTSIQDRKLPPPLTPKDMSAVAENESRPPETVTVADRPTTISVSVELQGAWQTKLFLGIGQIDPSDRHDFMLSTPEEQARGAAPKWLGELANVKEWMPGYPRLVDVGISRARWPDVPAAALYRLVGIRADDWIYTANLYPAEGELAPSGHYDLGRLEARSPTGFIFRVNNAPESEAGFVVKLERTPDESREEVSATILHVMELVRPELYEAFFEAGSLLIPTREEFRLVPIAPDLMVRLMPYTADGIPGTVLELAPVEGRVQVVSLDFAQLFPSFSGKAVSMVGRLVKQGMNAPVANAAISRMDAPLSEHQITGPDGEFRFDYLPVGETLSFQVDRTVEEGTRPDVPESWSFEQVMPVEPGEFSVTVEMPAYRWIVMRMNPEDVAKMEAWTKAPYPEFQLGYQVEKQNESGEWRVARTDHFLTEADRVWISAEEDSNYRIRVIILPWLSVVSESASVSAEKPQADVELRVAEWPTPDRYLSMGHIFKPGQDRIGVRINGPHRSIPEIRTTLSGDLRLLLGPATDFPMHIRVYTEKGEGLSYILREDTGAAVLQPEPVDQ